MPLMPDPKFFLPTPHILGIWARRELGTKGEMRTIPLPHTQEGSNQNHQDQHQSHPQSYDDTGEQFGLIRLLALLGALQKREGEEAVGSMSLPHPRPRSATLTTTTSPCFSSCVRESWSLRIILPQSPRVTDLPWGLLVLLLLPTLPDSSTYIFSSLSVRAVPLEKTK